MSDDIEKQLANFTIDVNKDCKKENECLYICKNCKWNIFTILLTIGLFTCNGINIAIIVDEKTFDKENVHYLSIFTISQFVTWINYLVYYCTNNHIVSHILKLNCIGLNSIVCWGDYILLTYTENDINTVIMINKIIVLWYQIFIVFQYTILS